MWPATPAGLDRTPFVSSLLHVAFHAPVTVALLREKGTKRSPASGPSLCVTFPQIRISLPPHRSDNTLWEHVS